MQPVPADVSVVVPTIRANEQPDDRLMDAVAARLGELGATTEIVHVRADLYGDALAEGFAQARGEHVLTLDHDFTGDLGFLTDLWAARYVELAIASRYTPGGSTRAPTGRAALSAVANGACRRLLAIDVHDMSSGYRLYRASAMKGIDTSGMGYEALHHVVVHVCANGGEVVEVPFDYRVDASNGPPRVGLSELSTAVLRSLPGLRTLRTSVAFADYDSRAYDSRIPFQRWWQRSRHRIVTSMAAAHIGGKILDVGCGSSRILGALPGAIGLDIQQSKLRYMHHHLDNPVVTGSVFSLPFRDGEFDCVVCSQVIEHVPTEPSPITELLRVLDPAGTLVLGTPDYGGFAWPAIERVYGFVRPNAYADEHISHYTRDSMLAALDAAGWECTELAHICRAEMIATFRRRPDGAASSVPARTLSGLEG